MLGQPALSHTTNSCCSVLHRSLLSLQDPSTLVTWKHIPKNALFYGKEQDVVPYSG